MLINLESFDLKKIKDIAAMEGKDPEALSEVEIWGIVSHALIVYKTELKAKEREKQRAARTTS